MSNFAFLVAEFPEVFESAKKIADQKRKRRIGFPIRLISVSSQGGVRRAQ
jgi:hypothetical protein